MKQEFIFKVDGVGFYARLWASKNEVDAVKEMSEGNILKTYGKDEVWAKKAWKTVCDAAKKADEELVVQDKVAKDKAAKTKE